MNCFSVSVFFCYFACKITNMGRIIGIISVVLTLTVLASCTDKRAMRERLDYVSQCNRADTVFTEEWLPTVDSLVNYFDRHGNANEKMMAHYLKGRVHHDMGESPIALECYQQATEMADTTKKDCDLYTLAAIYGQMASLFHSQYLPDNEMNAIIMAEHYAWKDKDTMSAIKAYELRIRPYFLKNETDSMAFVLTRVREKYLQLGEREKAAQVIFPMISILLDNQQLKKASYYLDIYERESRKFDSNEERVYDGEYYYDKGRYMFAIGNIDSARFYFYKAKDRGILEAGYKGLLSVYKKLNKSDSIAKYAELFANANDSSYLHVNQQQIEQIRANFNFSRSQKEAEKEKDKATRARVMLGVFVLFTFVLIGIICVIIWLNRRKQQKKRENILKLEKDLGDAQLARWEVQEELEKLKSNDFESVIAAKEKKEAELTRAIKRLQNENNIYKKKDSVKERDCLEDFRNSKIAQLFIRRATGKFEIPRPTDAEWSMLMSQFSKDIPVTFKSFGEGKPLSQLEQRICVLLILDISEKTISTMTDSVPSTVSNAKARASEKLFGKKAAQSLKTNLFHALKQV